MKKYIHMSLRLFYWRFRATEKAPNLSIFMERSFKTCWYFHSFLLLRFIIKGFYLWWIIYFKWWQNDNIFLRLRLGLHETSFTQAVNDLIRKLGPIFLVFKKFFWGRGSFKFLRTIMLLWDSWQRFWLFLLRLLHLIWNLFGSLKI